MNWTVGTVAFNKESNAKIFRKWLKEKLDDAAVDIISEESTENEMSYCVSFDGTISGAETLEAALVKTSRYITGGMISMSNDDEYEADIEYIFNERTKHWIREEGIVVYRSDLFSEEEWQFLSSTLSYASTYPEQKEIAESVLKKLSGINDQLVAEEV